MKPFLGIATYEYRMSITRVGLLIITGVFTLGYIYLGVQYGEFDHAARTNWWREAGQAAFSLNLFFPVLAGIVTADRAVRDEQLRVRELLRVTRLDNRRYILGKYLGVSLSILSLQFGIVLLATTAQVVFHRLNPILIPYSLAASGIIHGPMVFFITAFSLVCPLIMPLRVYQILFTGYWYWGNFLNPEVIPTVADTYLNASGRFVISGLFDVNFGNIRATPMYALINVLVLLGTASLALLAMGLVLTHRDRRT